jgi:hypothetical protein
VSAERWRPVVGWECCYMVSDFGRIKSVRDGQDKLLAGSQIRDGYHLLKLRDFPRQAARGVHCLVLEAFVGPRPGPDYEACHNDGSKANNHLSNLRWDTISGNSADRWLHGTMRGRNLLTDEQVVQIRTQANVHDLIWAARFGVKRHVIRNARTGRSFPWITTPTLKRSCAKTYTMESTLGVPFKRVTECPKGHSYAEHGKLTKRNIHSCKLCERIGTRKVAGWPEHLWELPTQRVGCRPPELIAWLASQSNRRAESTE